MRICSIWLTAALVSWCVSGFGRDEEPDFNVAETELLCRNLLRDVGREQDQVAQYRLLLRARALAGDLEVFLPADRAAALRRQLARTFRKLQLPERVVLGIGLEMGIVRLGASVYYWSKPVSQAAFVSFLNQAEVPKARVREWFARGWPDRVAERYVAPAPERPVAGVSYDGAKAFAGWLGRREGEPLLIPAPEQVPRNDREPISCWTSRAWQDSRVAEQELDAMFGGGFHTLMVRGEPVGEFPEASSPEVRLHLVATTSSIRRILLKQAAVPE